MTDFTQLSDKELSEALDFHRRQRNMSRGINEAMHMRQTKTVRLLEAEEARRLDENGIKGWKHAGSDISKMRAAAGKDVKLVRLKKDGTENKMHDATKMFRSEDEAQQHHDRVVGLNPKSKIAHNMYVNGKHVKTLGESVELDEETKYVVKGKSPFYKQDHFINTHETPKAQLIKKNIKHATRMNLETAKKVAKDWESHPNKYKTEVVPVNEAFEQIDELSKKTLGSYVKKASTDQYLKGQAVQYHTNKAQTADGVFAKQSKEKHYDAADKALKKASNRDTGIGRAVDRLAKEEVELDEGIKEKISGVIRREKQKEYPLLQNRRDVAATKAGAAYAAGDNKKGDRYMKWREDNMKKEEVEQIDELSKDTVNSYWKKAAAARYPLDVKARKAQDQKTNRIRSGKPLAGYKPKDELSPEEKRTHTNRIKGMNNAGKRLFRSEEVELDEARLNPDFVGRKFSPEQERLKGTAGEFKKIASASRHGKDYDIHKRYMGSNVTHHYVVVDKDDDKIVSQSSGKGFDAALKRANLHPVHLVNEAASYRDIGARNMWKASRKADKEADKMRAQQAKANAKAAAKASKPEEFKEEADLRITKVYNKWPKPATYAVHSKDRSYHKEFDSMEAAQAHKAEKCK